MNEKHAQSPICYMQGLIGCDLLLGVIHQPVKGALHFVCLPRITQSCSLGYKKSTQVMLTTVHLRVTFIEIYVS
jgi:hypothetical protein